MPVRPGNERAPAAAASRSKLERVVRQIGHLLPAQGPINVFIHHNTLHAFEHLPFDEAVLEASRLFGCQPYLSEDRYRQELRHGRIHEADVNAVLAAELGPRADATVLANLSRLELRRRIAIFGIPQRHGPALRWTLEETNVLKRLRADLPAEAQNALGLGNPHNGGRAEQARYIRRLWDSCRRAIERAANVSPAVQPAPIRHRDLLLAAFELDIDQWVHPPLIRATSAFLDQGLADWAMPGRERGLYRCFVDLYRSRLARWCGPIGKELQRSLCAEHDEQQDSWTSLARSLECLGLAADEWEPFLRAEALALRGFAGMIHQFELRPDRVPARAVPAQLVDFFAVRLLILRAALSYAAPAAGYQGSLAELRPWLRNHLPQPPAPSADDRAWPLFHLAQLGGLNVAHVDNLNAEEIARVEAELGEFDQTARRRLLHRAYERRLRQRYFDALAQHRPQPVSKPAFQVVFCIDEREESIRRHLEEVDPSVETFGIAGFFGVAMYYRGVTDAHARPLCPVAIRPRHFVAEINTASASGLRARLLRLSEQVGALVDKNVHLGSRRARRGAAIFAVLGALWVIPLVLRVVFPWLHRALRRSYDSLQLRRVRLAIEHQEAQRPPLGEQVGFTTEEMTEIVFSQLAATGIRQRFAPLVLILGHGSTSLNNPHESAHDCGACGGGRGGPNARAFAQMANLPQVRAALDARGLHIPSEVWFVGGERNTASNDIALYDTELAPNHVHALLRQAINSLESARRREAHERCRRFDNAAPSLTPAASLRHVQTRSADLAQPRPEFGHATNALCLIGRRSRTRGLFLDRRAFLVSYDANGDPDGAQLDQLLGAVVPVVAGISLEYYFGYVDPTNYGSGTKLPHNVTALVGVMDGAQSDLRTGLPWQMLEIHEPVRLSIVVEAKTALIRRLLEQRAELKRLVDHGWVFLATLDPASGEIVELDATGEHRYVPEHALAVCPGSSRAHYEGRRGHLPFVALGAATARSNAPAD
ncbi:MAG: DUF2309 domain-containing protein [Deltaproteobacteria bacterium]|nr:DUF2309 domain-containing protein [Deltaproteobacteria bacterium]